MFDLSKILYFIFEDNFRIAPLTTVALYVSLTWAGV